MGLFASCCILAWVFKCIAYGATIPSRTTLINPENLIPLHLATETLATISDPYPDKPRITFSPDGTFKITVFSDMHWGENPWDAWGPEQDANSTRLMETVLPSEKPDFVVLNGDLITGENAFKDNATLLIDRIVAPLNAAQIPFSSTQGNHDNQKNITHLQEIIREQQVAPLSYTRVAPMGVGGVEGPGNYWVPVYEKASGMSHLLFHQKSDTQREFHIDSTPILILWFFDSRGGFSYGDNSSAIPDWVDESVAAWIESESAAMNDAWGPPENRGALAFVHIPPHIIQKLQADLNSTKEPGLNADILGSGSTQSTTNEANVGQDDAFWNSLNANSPSKRFLISFFADHGDEWCIREPTKNVIFCFDKHAGYGGYGDPSWGYGVRNLVFSSTDPKAGIQTWIRLEEGDIKANVTLNADYT
ncbi:Metallo-dependent phosphatase-like protein [Lentinula aciculospora]|uniref:Metallo-dependent phosphatase-like protein n=1 Tax=Lentinula aciculospora TaxID=153920 RepID=A0A9W9AH35_9AGAR|nr:Metallo-dependent phosphatase-like protein [Lentinula aciculospora]